jgi:hypothetical protein
MPNEDVNVSIAEDHLDKIDVVVKRMQRAGLKVDQRLDAIGVVSGSIDPARVERLESLGGVASVERSRQVSIPPHEEETQ